MDIEMELLPLKSQRRKRDIELIVLESEKLGYELIKVDYSTGMIRFYQRVNLVAVNIYTTTLTVTTEIFHPKKGKSQLHRKRLSVSDIVKVLENPRLHTGKGYYKK